MKVIPFILLLVLGRVEYADKDGLHWSWVSFYNVVRFWVGVIPGLSPKLGNKMMGREFFLLFFVVLLWWSQGASILVLYMTSSILIVEAFFWCTSRHTELPWPGIKPVSPAVKAEHLNHWTTGEVWWFKLFSNSTFSSFIQQIFIKSHLRLLIR